MTLRAEAKVKEEKPRDYYCSIHKSSDGYIDSEGVWRCWTCYKSDEYLNPQGEIIITKGTHDGKLEARMLATRTHKISIEVWGNKNGLHNRMMCNNFDYLSSATRAWDTLITNLERKSPRIEY
jgi:hypothetical protein